MAIGSLLLVRTKRIFQVKASKEGNFLAWYQSLDVNSTEFGEVDEVLSSLKENATLGTRIPKDRWPKIYIKRYGINNLYKIDIRSGRRITYTILAEHDNCFVMILDCFLSHKDYEKFFGY